VTIDHRPCWPRAPTSQRRLCDRYRAGWRSDHVGPALPDGYSIEFPDGEIPIVRVDELVHLGVDAAERRNISVQNAGPVFGAKIVAVELAERGRLDIVGVEILAADGPTGKTGPLLEGDRIERPGLAGPVRGRAAVDTLAFPGAALLSVVWLDQEARLVALEQAVGDAAVELFLSSQLSSRPLQR
jgi:hypothetical protein